jgi:hypothetical protein
MYRCINEQVLYMHNATMAIDRLFSMVHLSPRLFSMHLWHIRRIGHCASACACVQCWVHPDGRPSIAACHERRIRFRRINEDLKNAPPPNDAWRRIVLSRAAALDCSVTLHLAPQSRAAPSHALWAALWSLSGHSFCIYIQSDSYITIP